MSKINFNDFVKKENQKLKDIKSTMTKDKTGHIFVKELTNLYTVLETILPQETESAISQIKLDETFNLILDEVDQKMVLINNYNLDSASQKMVVNFHLGKETLSVPTITIPTFIKTYLKINESHPYYFLAMSFCMQPKIYEIIQLKVALHGIN